MTDPRTEVLIALSAREIVRGNLRCSYDDFAAMLSVRVGERQTRGMIARLFDDEARRDSAARAPARERRRMAA